MHVLFEFVMLSFMPNLIVLFYIVCPQVETSLIKSVNNIKSLVDSKTFQRNVWVLYSKDGREVAQVRSHQSRQQAA